MEHVVHFTKATLHGDIASLARFRLGVATDSVDEAMLHLVELKGVGPATASAILSSCNKQVPFMADEVDLSKTMIG